MHTSYIFEAIMLICFGLAWPASIYKSYRSRSNSGKSIYFLYIILLGYINGIMFQRTISSYTHYVMFLFYINSCMVAIDIILYYRNKIINNR